MLSAFTQESDSGAAFVVKLKKQYYIAGIHPGRMVAEDSLGELSTLITPLYPHKEWINDVIASASNKS